MHSARLHVCQDQVTPELSTKHWTESRNDPLDLGQDEVLSKALSVADPAEYNNLRYIFIELF